MQTLTPRSQALLGKQLAQLHLAKTEKQAFGWHRNNTIGSTPQINPWNEDWIEFYTENRLRYQFDLARQKRMSFKYEEDLYEKIPQFFADYDPEASILHGDLWGGNASANRHDLPVIYDPATYYGDRETDIAFTELFGGFTQAFYQNYHQTYPLDPGYKIRKKLYNLYHVLNHYNLFGGGYASQAQSMIHELLTAKI